MDPETTALILVGYQNDYFAADGVLRSVVEEPNRVDEVLANTVGILDSTRQAGAFQAGTVGAQNIRKVLIAGMATSLCTDSTGRAAHKRGLGVTILADCTSVRTAAEQAFYCQTIFPLYGRALDSATVLREVQGQGRPCHPSATTRATRCAATCTSRRPNASPRPW